jgi:hypothetical protein
VTDGRPKIEIERPSTDHATIRARASRRALNQQIDQLL